MSATATTPFRRDFSLWPRAHGEAEPPPRLTHMHRFAANLPDLRERILDTQQKHGDLLSEAHNIWYQCGHTWNFTYFCGLQMMKSPNDLWTYQDLISRYRFKTVIECGTFTGASAAWFAFCMEANGIDGHVYTIDIDPSDKRPPHPRITYLDGSSINPELVAAVTAEIEHPLLLVLDSDHSEAHVGRELALYEPSLDVGDWLVVEDTNVGWPDDRGARGAVEDFLKAHPQEFFQDILCERYLLTMHPGGWMQRVAKTP